MKKWMKPGIALALVLVAVSAFVVKGHEPETTDENALEFQVAKEHRTVAFLIEHRHFDGVQPGPLEVGGAAGCARRGVRRV